MLYQELDLAEDLTVYENVELPLIYSGYKASERKEIVNSMLDKMQIFNKLNKKSVNM